jgi:hypothetical protein
MNIQINAKTDMSRCFGFYGSIPRCRHEGVVDVMANSDETQEQVGHGFTNI